MCLKIGNEDKGFVGKQSGHLYEEGLKGSRGGKINISSSLLKLKMCFCEAIRENEILYRNKTSLN